MVDPRARRVERRHHRVPGELVHDAVSPADLRRRPAMESRDAVGKVFAARSPTSAACIRGRPRTSTSRVARRAAKPGSGRSITGSSTNDGTSMPTRSARAGELRRESGTRRPHARRACTTRTTRSAESRSPATAAASAASERRAPRPELQPRILELAGCALEVGRASAAFPAASRIRPSEISMPRGTDIRRVPRATAQHALRLVHEPAREERLDRDGGGLPEDQDGASSAAARAAETDGLVDASERQRDPDARGAVVDDVLELVPRRHAPEARRRPPRRARARAAPPRPRDGTAT